VATSMMKQRLIGAAVLIALGVIFIPMLLTGDGKFLSGESDSNVPPKPMYELEAPKVLPLDKRAGQSSEPVAEAAPRADKMASESSPAEGREEVKQASGTEKASGDEAQIVAESSSKMDTPPAETPAQKPPVKEPVVKEAVKEKAASEPATEKEAASKVQAPAPKPVENKVTKPAVKKPIVSGWVVQLGSFSVQKNALKLRDSLRKNGHASFVEEITHNGKKSYRVRVGPEQTRELANELKKKLKAETKLDGFVVEFPSS